MEMTLNNFDAATKLLLGIYRWMWCPTCLCRTYFSRLDEHTWECQDCKHNTVLSK